MSDDTVDDARAGGDGPTTDREWSQKDYHHPAAVLRCL
jgi:hypothetical protein